MNLPPPVTIPYKTLSNGHKILLDIYYPASFFEDTPNPCNTLGTVVYFHGGGLTVGNRRSWFPAWLHEQVLSMGYLFICPDYRLIPAGSTTGAEILQDVLDVFNFLGSSSLPLPSESGNRTESIARTCQVDPQRIAVAGSSAGGLCAYFAATHASPKPKVLVSLYGMGGDFLTPHYLQPKTEVFFRGRELLDPEGYSSYLFPGFYEKDATPISDSPLAYHDHTYKIPGFPANPRMVVTRLYLQLGVFLDYYTGRHSPSISAQLRNVERSDEEIRTVLGSESVKLFPQFNVSSDWPPTLLIHGENDTAVPVAESRNLEMLLKSAGVECRLVVVKGKEHSFDYAMDLSELRWEFAFVGGYLREALG